METKRKPASVKGIITAFARSDNKGINTYGTNDGKIYVEEKNGRVKELVGHRSRVTRLKVNGNQLYSSSYDGKMNLWLYENENVEPILLFESDESDAWIRYFTIDNSKTYLWSGDNNGNLTEILVSINTMVERLKNHLLTEDQWDTYVGKNASYKEFINSVKGGKK
jgi:WD40 repeat protein